MKFLYNVSTHTSGSFSSIPINDFSVYNALVEKNKELQQLNKLIWKTKMDKRICI